MRVRVKRERLDEVLCGDYDHVALDHCDLPACFCVVASHATTTTDTSDECTNQNASPVAQRSREKAPTKMGKGKS